jgi:hypothetical protein
MSSMLEKLHSWGVDWRHRSRVPSRTSSLGSTTPGAGVLVRACVVSCSTGHRRTPLRSTILNPYAVQTIDEDAQCAVPGDRLEIRVATDGRGEIAALNRHFARLRRRGVAVAIIPEGYRDHLGVGEKQAMSL